MKPKPNSALRIALLATAALLPCAQAADEVIARVAGEEIRGNQIKPYLATVSDEDREALLKNPAALSQVVRNLITQQMLYKEALAAGWEKSPDVAEQIERLKQGLIAESYLQSLTKIPDGFPSDQDVKAVYEARKDQMNVPKQIELAQIFVAVSQEADKAEQEKARARIDEVAKAAKSGDFAAIAREKSDERETASRGGAVGWLALPQIQPEIRAKVSSLPKGGLTEPVRLADGWYVVKVLDVKEPHTASLEEVKDQLVKLLRNERTRANREAYLSKIQQQKPVVLDELALGKLIEK